MARLARNKLTTVMIAAVAAGVASILTLGSSQGQPMSGATGMPMSNMQCGQMHAMAMHSAADKAYMQAMMGMHKSMMSNPMTGDADHDFLVMMIPHHQSAVDMARAELQYGKDSRVRALASSIIKAQQAEIEKMQSWLKSAPPSGGGK